MEEEVLTTMPERKEADNQGPEEHSPEMYFGEPDTLESLGYSFEIGV